MTVDGLCNALSFEVVSQEEDREVNGVFCCDLLSVVMARAPENSVWVTVIGNVNTIAVASLTDVACIILAEGFFFDDAAISAAKGKVTLLRSGEPVYETAVSVGKLI